MGTAWGFRFLGRAIRINMDPSEFFAASRPAATTYRQMHARLRDHAALAELSVDAQPRAFLFLDEESAGMDDVTLWAGEAGTTSHTHYDAWPNAFTQVYGRKRFLLWAPEDWRGLALHPHAHPAHRGSQLDFDEHNGLLVGCTPPSWVQRMRSLWGGSDEDAVTACAVPFTAELSPGEVLLLPPFWFHRVTSLTFSTALSALSLGEQGGRFDRACRQGLPAYLLDRTAPPTMRAALVRRFITSLVHALMPPDEASTYVRRALVETRYAPLDSAPPLRCEVPFGSCGEDPSAYIAAGAAAEEQEVVKRVAAARTEAERTRFGWRLAHHPSGLHRTRRWLCRRHLVTLWVFEGLLLEGLPRRCVQVGSVYSAGTRPVSWLLCFVLLTKFLGFVFTYYFYHPTGSPRRLVLFVAGVFQFLQWRVLRPPEQAASDSALAHDTRTRDARLALFHLPLVV